MGRVEKFIFLKTIIYQYNINEDLDFKTRLIERVLTQNPLYMRRVLEVNYDFVIPELHDKTNIVEDYSFFGVISDFFFRISFSDFFFLCLTAY